MTFAQWRNTDLQHAQLVVQILAKTFFAHCCFKVLTGRGHYPNIDRHRLCVARPFDFALLQKAQQVSLGVQRQIADFIEQ